MADATIEITKNLIARPSITPSDEGCQGLIAQKLTGDGFDPEHLRFGDVDNLWLRRGRTRPLFVFAGHSDVVPTGPLDRWRFDPFVPTVEDGYLYGRGAADMKASLAAFVTASKTFVRDYPTHRGSIALLITSDEEGPAVDGTARVVDALSARGDVIDYCIVGEPSSERQLGDVIKIGRRGSLSARLRIYGTQGHVAYPQLVLNPVHILAPALHQLSTTEWDQGDDDFPPTTFQVTDIHAGVGASNIVPGELSMCFNFRFCPQATVEELKRRIEEILGQHELRYDIDWTLTAEPFLTSTGELVAATRDAIFRELGIRPQLETTGGTSDGRFIAPTGAQLIELGPINHSIHQVDEHVLLKDPDRLSKIYYRILVTLMAT